MAVAGTEDWCLAQGHVGRTQRSGVVPGIEPGIIRICDSRSSQRLSPLFSCQGCNYTADTRPFDNILSLGTLSEEIFMVSRYLE